MSTEPERLAACQEKIGYQFENETWLRAALTHASSADRRIDSNERLEFLGDAILGKVICEKLFHIFPKANEGELTKIKSDVVSRKSCEEVSRRLGLDDCLTLGKGLNGQALPQSLYADVFEAIIAAIYLDGGTAPAETFILHNLQPRIDSVADRLSANHKSELQQLAQRQFGTTPTYVVLDEQGPDHNKSFLISAEIDGTRHSGAWGAKKKDAEQRAAEKALEELRQQAEIPKLPDSKPAEE